MYDWLKNAVNLNFFIPRRKSIMYLKYIIEYVFHEKNFIFWRKLEPLVSSTSRTLTFRL